MQDIDDDLVEKMGIDQPVMGGAKGIHQFLECDEIPRMKGQFPQNNIVPGHPVAVDGDLTDNVGRGLGMILGKCRVENKK